MTCEMCIIERTQGPCPHDARREVERYGLAQYRRGLRKGLTALLNVLIVVDGHQEKGARRRPIPLSLVRAALQGRAMDIVSAMGEVDYPTAEEWRAEARKAFTGDDSCDG